MNSPFHQILLEALRDVYHFQDPLEVSSLYFLSKHSMIVNIMISNENTKNNPQCIIPLY